VTGVSASHVLGKLIHLLSLRTSRRAVLVTSSVAAGALILALAGSSTAEAATTSTTGSASATVVSGTGTVYMTKSYIANMAAYGITMTPQNPDSVNTTLLPGYTITTWSTDGGDANLKACTGTEDLNGGMLVTDSETGRELLLTDVRFDVATDSIDYTVTTPAGSETIAALDLAGLQGGVVAGTNAVYGASELFVNPEAAVALDTVLGTTAFEDTGLFGAFSTSYTLSQPNSSPGIAECG
jgi:hypothetical protein